MKEYFGHVRYLGQSAVFEKTLQEKEKYLRNQILEWIFESRLQQKLYVDETNRIFCDVLPQARQLELIQKNAGDVEQRRDKSTRADRVRLSYDDWEHNSKVRASFPNSHSQVDEKFAALQTSMGSGNSTGQTGRNSGKIGRRYSADDEEHELELSAADSSNDADACSDESSDGGIDGLSKNTVSWSCWWSSQYQFGPNTTDTTATTATTKF